MDGLADGDVILACAATVGLLKSAMKGKNPVNRGIVKLTIIDNNIEIVEHCVAESAQLHKQFPPSRGDYNNVVCDPITEDYKKRSVRAYATARFAAIQLAKGRGLINDKADIDEWEGSEVHADENRKNLIIWLDESAILLVVADKYAPYGGKNWQGPLGSEDCYYHSACRPPSFGGDCLGVRKLGK